MRAEFREAYVQMTPEEVLAEPKMARLQDIKKGEVSYMAITTANNWIISLTLRNFCMKCGNPFMRDWKSLNNLALVSNGSILLKNGKILHTLIRT